MPHHHPLHQLFDDCTQFFLSPQEHLRPHLMARVHQALKTCTRARDRRSLRMTLEALEQA